MEFNSSHQSLVYVVDGNLLDGRLHAFKENTEAVVVSSNKNGIDVNADKGWYMVLSRDQIVERNHTL